MLTRRCPQAVTIVLVSLVAGCPILAQQPPETPAITPAASPTPTPPMPAPQVQPTQAPAAQTPPPQNTPVGESNPSAVSPQNAVTAPASQPNAPYSVIDEKNQPSFNVKGQQLFSPGQLPNTAVNFNERDLFSVLYNVRRYFSTAAQADPNILREGLLGTQGVTVADTMKTLDFMISVLYEDILSNRPTRLKDPKFINDNFKVIKWKPYNPKSPEQSQLRITKYAVFRHLGSRTKTAEFTTPIYQINDQFANDGFQNRYTKQQVLSGIFNAGGVEAGKVKPIAYLSREGLEDALLQGTVLIKFPDGGSAFFNVDRNNGMQYVRGVKQRSQKRYWYFKEVKAIKGYGGENVEKIPVKPGVTFAGDILNIGLGKIIVIEQGTGANKKLQLGAIADTGGAFLPNLHQLDFLAGIFQNKADFQTYLNKHSDYAGAYILVKR
ncbi:MAG: hypothetical protein ACFCU8_17710 [Thermosynechococcaceae cyanobacterium]